MDRENHDKPISYMKGPLWGVKPVHLHQHTRAARARKSANMVSANMVFLDYGPDN